MMKREAFLVKPKCQCHLPQWGEWVYGAQSWKKKKITIWIHVCCNWKTNLNTKNDGKWSFLYETKASMSFIPMRSMSLWQPIMKRMKITIWVHVCPNWQMNFNAKKFWKEKFFMWNQSINVICPNDENKFRVPNREKKGDYYVNPCLFQLINKL